MKIRKQEELENEYRDLGGIEELKLQKDSLITDYPFSVLLTADYVEIENAERWCAENVSEWTKLWYGKIDYDYGYIEFFFKNEEDKSKFENTAESLVTEYPSGVKGRTIDSIDVSE